VLIFIFFQAEDGIRDRNVTGVQTCALPILMDIIETSDSSEKVEKSDHDSIVFETARGKMEYQLNNTRIIKSINNEGFITMLFDVTTWNISDEKQVIKIKIKTNGEFDEEIIIKK